MTSFPKADGVRALRERKFKERREDMLNATKQSRARNAKGSNKITLPTITGVVAKAKKDK